jgi:tetratricopeptide (TPR) repeat protein
MAIQNAGEYLRKLLSSRIFGYCVCDSLNPSAWVFPELLILALLASCCVAQQLSPASDGKGWTDQGLRALQNGQYKEAVAAFTKAGALDSSDVTPHLYLAHAYSMQFVNEPTSPESSALAQKAEGEYRRVLAIDSKNKAGLTSAGMLAFYEARDASTAAKADEARNWLERSLAIDPKNRDAFYTLGVITYWQWYRAYLEVRSVKLGMGPSDRGPFRDANVRASLRRQWSPAIDEAIRNLSKALELDPKYSNAMVYLNLLIRERSDLLDSQKGYQEGVRQADEWVLRALNTMAEKARSGTRRNDFDPLRLGPPGPPNPPPPPAQPRPLGRVDGAPSK